MKMLTYINLKDFPFWGRARYITQLLTEEDFQKIEACLEEDMATAGEIYTETEINDIFWFETDAIAEILGYEDYEDFFSTSINRLINFDTKKAL